jgi:hypothetical protein
MKEALTDGLWGSVPPTLSRLNNCDSYLEGLVSKILSNPEQDKSTLNTYLIF